MKRGTISVVFWLAISTLIVAACGPRVEAPLEEQIQIDERESGISTLTLTARAVERLGIQTADVEDREAEKVVPYASVIYDADGATWAYVATEPLSFERVPIAVESIAGDEAVLSDGPVAGTPVVIVGAAELYGAETGVGGGH